MKKNSKPKVLNYLYEHALDVILGIPSLITLYGYIKRIILRFVSSKEVTISTFELILGAFVLSGAMLWLIIFRHYFFPLGYEYPRSYLGSSYMVEKTTIRYRMDPDDTRSTSKTLEIKSKTNGLERIKQKSLWPSSPSCKTPYGTDGVKDIYPDNTLGIYDHFIVAFKEPVLLGKRRTISYKWPKTHNCSSSKPYVGIDTELPTRIIEFDISLGKEYANKEVIFEVFRSSDSDCPLIIEHSNFDDMGRIKWRPKDVKRFRYYRVRWEWNDGNDGTEAQKAA